MKKRFLILQSLLSFVLLCSCNKTDTIIQYNDIVRERIETPILHNVENIINCKKTSYIDYFNIEYIYEEENRFFECSTNTMPFVVPCEKSGVYSVRVKAISNNENICDSLWSDYIQFASPIRIAINTPVNLRVENNSIVKFDSVDAANKYEVMINDESLFTYENYLEYNFLPGINYQIKVRSLVDKNNYTKDSNWSSYIVHSYTITLPVPTNLNYSDGKLAWSCEKNINGFIVTCTNTSSMDCVDYSVENNFFYLSSLSSGTYDIKVKAKGIGSNPDSEYSSTKRAIINYSYSWNSEFISNNFTSWESARINNINGCAQVVSGNSYGGIISPSISVNYSTSPLLMIDYKSINYGYLGKYLISSQPYEYYYQGDTICEASDVTQIYSLNQYVYGTLPNSVADNFKILIGFCGAPGSGVIASEIRSIKIGNINVL